MTVGVFAQSGGNASVLKACSAWFYHHHQVSSLVALVSPFEMVKNKLDYILNVQLSFR